MRQQLSVCFSVSASGLSAGLGCRLLLLQKKRDRIESGMSDITDFAGTRGMVQEERGFSSATSMREQVAEVRKQRGGGGAGGGGGKKQKRGK